MNIRFSHELPCFWLAFPRFAGLSDDMQHRSAGEKTDYIARLHSYVREAKPTCSGSEKLSAVQYRYSRGEIIDLSLFKPSPWGTPVVSC